MKNLILITTILGLTLSTLSCKTQERYSEQKNHFPEIVFSTEEWKNKTSENLQNFYRLNISNQDKVKINHDLDYISYFEETFLEENFAKLDFSNHFQANTEYYLVALFTEGEVFYNQIYILEKGMKCNGFLYTQAGRSANYTNHSEAFCETKKSQLTNLLRGEQVLNAGVRNNMLLIWHIDQDLKEDFNLYFNPNYLQLQEAEDIIYMKTKGRGKK